MRQNHLVSVSDGVFLWLEIQTDHHFQIKLCRSFTLIALENESDDDLVSRDNKELFAQRNPDLCS